MEPEHRAEVPPESNRFRGIAYVCYMACRGRDRAKDRVTHPARCAGSTSQKIDKTERPTSNR
jgi:hypothetical protein